MQEQQVIQLTKDEFEDMLQRASERGAEIAIEKMTNKIYTEIGKGIARKAFIILGAALLFMAAKLKMLPKLD